MNVMVYLKEVPAGSQIPEAAPLDVAAVTMKLAFPIAGAPDVAASSASLHNPALRPAPKKARAAKKPSVALRAVIHSKRALDKYEKVLPPIAVAGCDQQRSG